MTPAWPAMALVAVLVAIAVSIAAAIRSARFNAHLQALERSVGEPSESPSRTDLPREVAALAARLGAHSDGGAVTLRQRGQMWSKPDAGPMAFKARQTMSPSRLDFIWNADAGPGRLVKAADYYVAGLAGLEVKALGLLDIARKVGGADMEQGEALRYLAELPWNPDALLLNHRLDWTVLDHRTLRVTNGAAAVTFALDDQGLPQRMNAPSRPYMEKGRTRPLPWSGRFSHYQRMSGRLIPTQGEVAWSLDGEDFVYWRATVTAWSAASGGRPCPLTAFELASCDIKAVASASVGWKA